jgi:3',5'-cyclic AMP phosphodiesterase CpdA
LSSRVAGWLERLGLGRQAPDSEPSPSPSGQTAAHHAHRVRDVLDPDFLQARLEQVNQSGPPALADQDYQDALAELTDAKRRASEHRARVDGTAGIAGTPDRPDAAFFPRHPALSILQSTLEACLNDLAGEVLEEVHGEEASRTRRPIKQLRSDSELMRQFGPCDVRWINSKLAEGIRFVRGRPKFPDRAPPAVRIADDARVVIVGDWGTGLPAAAEVGVQMGEELAAAAGRDRHVIHLGDVYYSGWKEEFISHFLPYWPHASGDSTIKSWALNGNHDMYSGGHGYFGYLLRDPRFAGQQGCSHFRLENAHWQLLGLDTSYDDEDLAGSQASWVAEQVTGSSAKTMLLSHHQLFSAYDPTPSTLGDRLAPILEKGPLDAWFWGHEHRCVVYEPTAQVRAARCIGHGGVPVFVPPDDAPVPDGVRYEYRGATGGGSERWGLFGFAVLDFQGPSISVRYINEKGEEHYREQLG